MSESQRAISNVFLASQCVAAVGFRLSQADSDDEIRIILRELGTMTSVLESHVKISGAAFENHGTAEVSGF